MRLLDLKDQKFRRWTVIELMATAIKEAYSGRKATDELSVLDALPD
jgi:hypothetical protein